MEKLLLTIHSADKFFKEQKEKKETDFPVSQSLLCEEVQGGTRSRELGAGGWGALEAGLPNGTP